MDIKTIRWLVMALSIYSLTCAQPKKLILHFDVNKTIIALDAVQNKGKEEMVNSILAENTYARWNGNTEQSYYNYLADVIAQEQPTLDRASDEFKNVRNERLKRFRNHLEQYPALRARYDQEKAKLLTLLSKEDIVIFPSFLKFLTWLEQQYPNDYTLHLRTFGKDLPEIVPLIERGSSIRFAAHGKFVGKELFINGEKESVLHFLNKHHGKHYAIRDDYLHWKSGNFQRTHGKPFPIDSNNTEQLSIFFDDNAAELIRPIVCPLKPDGTPEDAKLLIEKGHLIAVNPKQAMLNDDYFIDKLKSVIAT